MPWLDPVFMSAHDAERYLNYTIAQHERWFAELSTLIHGSWSQLGRGPIEALDGTLDSLVPLRQWTYDFVVADFPGLPKNVISPLWYPSDAEPEPPIQGHPAAYLMSILPTYAAHVVQRYAPEARWKVISNKPGRIPFDDHQYPGLHLDTWSAPIELGVRREISQWTDEEMRLRYPLDPAFYRERVHASLPPFVRDLVVAPDPAFLPAPGTPIVPRLVPPFVPTPRDLSVADAPDPVRDPLPRPEGAEDAPEVPAFARENFFYLAAVSPDDVDDDTFDDVEALPVIKPVGLHKALLALGFECQTEPVHGRLRLERGGVEYVWAGAETVLTAESEASEAKLRAIAFEFLKGVRTPSARWLVAALQELAKERGIYLTGSL